MAQQPKPERPSPAETRRILLGIEGPEHEIEQKFFKPNWRAKAPREQE